METPSQANARFESRGKLDIPKGEPITPPATAGTLTVDGMKTMLENMGYEPKLAEYASGSKYIVCPITRGTWTFGFSIDLGPDGSMWWFSMYLGEVKEPEKATPAALLKVIESELAIWPSFFVYSSGVKGIFMYRPLRNADLKPAVLRTNLETMMGNVESTAAVWDTSKWSGSPPAATATK